MSSVKPIVDLLLEAGFERRGHTPSRYAGSFLRGGRHRLRRGKQYVTVGRETVCFYKVRMGMGTNHHKLKTDNIEGIRDFLESLPS